MSTLHHVDTIASTVPTNGDVNPYGVAVVPVTTGALVANNILVSNFNNFRNLQGTGTTIVQVSPSGSVTPFSTIVAASLSQFGGCPGGVGLTTALVALRSGFVIVGSLPTTDGTSATATQPGCLIVLNSNGNPVGVLSGNGINGPWDMTALDRGGTTELFVTNVLNGTVAAGGSTVDEGTVLRLKLNTPPTARPPKLLKVTQIGSGFAEHLDPAALVIGPTGVGLGPNGTLYVADTVNSKIQAIPKAAVRNSDDGIGQTVTTGGALNGPLGLAIAPNGNILTVNSGDGNMVETTPGRMQVAVKTVDDQGSPAGAGNLFGLAVKPGADAVYFVDDFGGPSPNGQTNNLNLLH
jgi:hypothetical protein